MNEYLDALTKDLDNAWDLAMKINDLSEEDRNDVAKAWGLFQSDELGKEIVDVEKTLAQGQNPPLKVFMKSIYGIQYNDKTKYWTPFRWGEIDIPKFTAP